MINLENRHSLANNGNSSLTFKFRYNKILRVSVNRGLNSASVIISQFLSQNNQLRNSKKGNILALVLFQINQ